MILWFVDRFGLPGKYHRIWLHAVTEAGLKPSQIRIVSLHRELAPRQLLTKFSNRKAPTWHPDAQDAIETRINLLTQQLKPAAIVLAAPESLCVLGLSQEVATLHNLRGSVYWRRNIPHIVTLPISAWTSMVNQKDIGAANYGFDSAEKLNQAIQAKEKSNAGNQVQGRPDSLPERRGQVHQPIGIPVAGAEAGIEMGQRAAGTPNGSGYDGGRIDGVQSRLPAFRPGQSVAAGTPSSISRGFLDANAQGEITRRMAERLSAERGWNISDPGRTDVAGATSRTHALPVGDRIALDPRAWPGLGEVDSDRGLPTDSSDAETSDLHESDDGERFDSGSDDAEVSGSANIAEDSGESAGDDDGDDADSDRDSDEVGRTDDSDVSPVGKNSDGLVAPEDVDQDRFFYEPVLSPVGRFTITADMAKLARVLKDGRNANGPVQPYVLRY